MLDGNCWTGGIKAFACSLCAEALLGVSWGTCLELHMHSSHC